MKRIVLTKTGGPEVLRIEHRDDPAPGKGEVALRVKASGINFADILARKGLYPDAPRPPCVIGYEVAGVVESVGEDVDPRLVGTSVLSLTRFNGYADYVIVPQGQVFVKPEAVSFEQAAAIPVNYTTAYLLVVVMGSLTPGESVLIHNVGGGVGLAALDIAKKIGAVTYGTAREWKHGFLEERGLDYAIDYTREDWSTKVLALTKGYGVELVIDPIGGANWRKSYKVLRRTGRLGMFGISSAAELRGAGKLGLLRLLLQTPWYHPLRLMNANKGVFGVNLGHLWNEGAKVAQWMSTLLEGVDQGWVRPYVDRVFSFEQVGDAHTYIEQRKNIGKVVLVP